MSKISALNLASRKRLPEVYKVCLYRGLWGNDPQLSLVRVKKGENVGFTSEWASLTDKWYHMSVQEVATAKKKNQLHT